MEFIGAEKKEKSTAEIEVKVSAEEFEQAVAKAYLKDRGKITLPGFRKGKAPRKMIESIYGEGVFYETALDEIYPTVLQFAVEQGKLDVVGTPSITDFNVDDDKNVTLKILVDVYPEFELGQYKGLSAVKLSALVGDKEVDDQIETIRNQNARLEEVERPAALGDSANIDFEGFVNGVAFDGGKGEDYDLSLGSGTFIPGFEDQVVGMSAGEEKDINVTFPENYQADLAGKDAVFKVKVNSVREKILPELDDEFAKDVSEFDTLAEYRESVRKDMLERRQADNDEMFANEIFDKLATGVECDIPASMIENEAGNMLDEYRYRMSSSGLDFATYLNILGSTEEQMKETLKPNAEKRIRLDLAIEKIAAAENIEVTDEEVEEQYAQMAKTYNMEADNIKNMISADIVKNQLRMDKARKLVLDSAVALDPSEVPAEEPKTEEKAEEKTDEKPKRRTRKKAEPKPEETAEAEAEKKE